MREAHREAKKAMEEGEVPIGCVVVCSGQIIGRGFNKTNLKRDATRHAEIEAIDQIIINQKMDVSILSRSKVYVTCEPCIMCAWSLRLVRIFHKYIKNKLIN
eukprot:TRINITY_DN5651_c0_g1_i1.p1 TRINITY_DN5651_c0_g1~~TRINITY_DN5651_c0_g1_i1.p1  ORF type:complete len:102 (-),score=18.72 TRINITY_DN5651_c0_g1_i1:115-420(-)